MKELSSIRRSRQQRLLANLAVARTKIRQALFAAARLAREHGYQDQGSVTAVERLAALSDIDEPYYRDTKQIGIQAAAAGRFDCAMQYLQLATISRRGQGDSGAISARVSRSAMGTTAKSMPHRVARTAFHAARNWAFPIDPFRIAITCSAIQDEDGPTVLIMKRAEHFKRLGFDVSVVSSGVSVTNSRFQAGSTCGAGCSVLPPANGERQGAHRRG